MTLPSSVETPTPGIPPRRQVLGVALAATGAVCAGCSSDGSSASAAPQPPATSAPAGGTTAASSAATTAGNTAASSTTGSSAPAQALAATSAVPVGGGTVLTDQQIVVTQPTAGVFKAFTAVCTHAGCTVSKVENGTIDCPCHGSRYSVADGAVVNGPAQHPLEPIAITVSGGQVLKS